MKIGPLFEVILYVSDMDRAVRFYRDMLGFSLLSPQADDYRDVFWVVMGTGECKLCLHGGGKGEPGVDRPKIVFRVDDIHACREELVQKGLSLHPVFSPAEGVLVCNGMDPDHNPFSLESSSVS